MNIKTIIRHNSFVYVSSILSFIILLIIIFLFPVEFSSYRTTDTLAPIWFFITSTGGEAGAIFIIVLILIYLAIHFKITSKRQKDVFAFIAIVVLFQMTITGLSLFVLKDYFRNPRPSQLYFMERRIAENEIDFLNMPAEKKRLYLQERFDSGEVSPGEVYTPIFKHWIRESGYSFPSGHAQTAFFLGTILCFVFFKLHLKKFYALIPFVWAILLCLSRVIIGIHFPADVMGGAFIGMIAAFFVIALKPVNRIFGRI